MSAASILAGLIKGAVIHIFGSVVTEKLLAKVLARLAISSLEKLASMTETKIDDEIIKPIVESLKKEI